jgi:hypothetical protein
MEALDRPERIFDELGLLGALQQLLEEASSRGPALGIGRCRAQDFDRLPEMKLEGTHVLDVCR